MKFPVNRNSYPLVRRLPKGLPCFVLIGIFLGVLGSCATSGAPPIASREPPPSRKINTHEVQQGDSLYSIAWRYETDFREMARINGLREPYALRRGQVLKIYDDGSAVPRRTTAAVVDRSPPSRPITNSGSNAGSRSGNRSSGTSSPATEPKSPNSVSKWAWPISGRIIKSFGTDSLTKGITLNPGSQTTVKAAADGIVVYAGTGLRGYGNLLIIKHSDLFLSAYGYNDQLLAKEGDQVRLDQSIAKVGRDPDGNNRLYFEIRKDGKPVDPIRYLP